MNSLTRQIVVLTALVLLSAYFSATETAFSSLNPIKLKNKAKNGNKRAKNTLNLCEKYDKLLSTILIGNNIVNILSHAHLLSFRDNLPAAHASVGAGVMIRLVPGGSVAVWSFDSLLDFIRRVKQIVSFIPSAASGGNVQQRREKQKDKQDPERNHDHS